MANFAQIVDNKIVRIIVLADEQAETGIEFIEQTLKQEGLWLQAPEGAAVDDLYDAESGTFKRPGQALTLDQAKLLKDAAIQRELEARASMLLSGYSATERSTWPIQQSEALAWSADSDSPTPFIDLLAQHRDVSATAMRERVLAKVVIYLADTGKLIGVSQRLRDAAMAAVSLVELDAITWPAED